MLLVQLVQKHCKPSPREKKQTYKAWIGVRQDGCVSCSDTKNQLSSLKHLGQVGIFHSRPMFLAKSCPKTRGQPSHQHQIAQAHSPMLWMWNWAHSSLKPIWKTHVRGGIGGPWGFTLQKISPCISRLTLRAHCRGLVPETRRTRTGKIWGDSLSFEKKWELWVQCGQGHDLTSRTRTSHKSCFSMSPTQMLRTAIVTIWGGHTTDPVGHK